MKRLHFERLGQLGTMSNRYADTDRAFPDGRALTLEDVLKRPWFSEIRQIARDQKQAMIMVAEQHGMLNFRRAGSRVFHLASGLCEALRATDFRLSADLLRPPFQAFYISFGSFDIVSPEAGGMHPLEGCYVVESFENIQRGATRCLTVFMCPRSGDSSQWAGGFLRIPIGASDKIESREHVADLYSQAGIDAVSIVNLVINAILYLSSPEAELDPCRSEAEELRDQTAGKTSHKKLAKLERQIERASMLPYTLVGKSISVIPQEERRNHTGVVDDPNSIERHWRLGYRIQVRGHWKMQVHGEARGLRRPLWIRPYWKGPDTAERIHRDYKLTGKTA